MKILKLFLIATIIIFLVIILLVFNNKLLKPKKTPSPLPTPTPVKSVFPTIIQKVVDKPGTSEKLIEIVKKREPLENKDQEIRKKLISSLGNKSGIIDSNSYYTIEYVKAPDTFQTEIKTTDAQAAKEKATNWFLSQGFSKEGICKLPLFFYLDSNTKSKLNNFEFNPLPEGC